MISEVRKKYIKNAPWGSSPLVVVVVIVAVRCHDGGHDGCGGHMHSLIAK